MKKITLILFSLISVSVLNAQITVTSADMPGGGDSILVSVATSIGTSDATLTGANFNWDFSALTGTSQRYEKFDSPTSFPLLYAVLFNIFNTSFGKENRTLTSLPIPLITFSAAYDFFKKSSTQLKQVGAGYTINGTPLPFMYTSSDVIYRFPMNYNNTDSSDYQFGLQIPTIGYYGESGHRVNTVDGWGTCTLPMGSFPVLRVKSVITSTDTLSYTGLPVGINIPRPTRIEYKWIANNKKIPVLEIDGNDLMGNFVITNVEYLDNLQAPSGIKSGSLMDSHSLLFPNPVDKYSTLFYQLNDSSPVKVTITDMIGKATSTILDQTQAKGNHELVLNADLLKLTQGIYFVTLQTNTYKETTKMIVEKTK